jgi:hypothetical protein
MRVINGRDEGSANFSMITHRKDAKDAKIKHW